MVFSLIFSPNSRRNKVKYIRMVWTGKETVTEQCDLFHKVSSTED